jgi:hypothetical protein
MKGYSATEQAMTDVARILEQARRQGRDAATTLRIARATLAYTNGPDPAQSQTEALAAIDEHLRKLG